MADRSSSADTLRAMPTSDQARRRAHPLAGSHDVLICGASFAGLAVARELAGSGADVLILDRYEIGERQTSACGIPTDWLRRAGPDGVPSASASTRWSSTRPTGPPATGCPGPSPPSTTASSAQLLWDECDARFETAKVERPRRERQRRRRDRDRDRPRRRSPRRWSSTRSAGAGSSPPGDGYQPPDAPLSRGLEVHPAGERRGPRDLDRPPLRPGRLRLVASRPATSCGSASAPSTRASTSRTRPMLLAEDLEREPVRYQGNWIPHKLRPATEGGVFFAGDSAGHCLPLTAEGIRTALYFGIALGRELRARRRGAPDPRAGRRHLRRLPRLPRVEVPLDAAGAEAGAARPAARPRAGADPADRLASASSTGPSATTSTSRRRTTSTQRMTRKVPASSRATPSSRSGLSATSSRPNRPRRSIATEAVSWPVTVAAATPPAPITETAISALVT